MKEGKFSAKLNNSNNQQHQNGHLSPFKLAKLLDPEASWDKDQLGDVLHWIRQFVALVCGLLWGAIPLVGGIWIGLFLLISSGIIYVYYAMILKIDEDDFGGHGTLLQEGLFASITLFLMRIKIRTPGNPNCGVEKTNKLASKILMDCTGSELLINPV